MVYVRLFVDTEGDLYYNIPSPHFSRMDMIKWRLNKLIGRLYRYPNPSIKGLANLVFIFKKYKIPATFCISGHLYLKRCGGWREHESIAPKNKWFNNKIGKNWYYWDKGGDYLSKPGLYFGDFIEKEMKDTPYFRFGLHGFSHEALTLESRKELNKIVKEGLLAAKKIGIRISSFAAPFEMISDKADPARFFNILRKNGINETQYAGQEDGLNKLRSLSVNKPTELKGIKLFWISDYIEGTSSDKKIRDTINNVFLHANTDKTFVLVTHDFTWRDPKKIERIILSLSKDRRVKFI